MPLLLSYLSAGFAKLISSDWRGGSAIAGVLNTRQYGTWPLAAWLSRHSWSAIFVCWSVILFECLGPLVAFTGQASLVAFLSAGLFFHLVTAVTMGLNTFLWAFLATYPAVVFLVASVWAWL